MYISKMRLTKLLNESSDSDDFENEDYNFQRRMESVGLIRLLEGGSPTISLYHGGARWYSKPEIRGAKKGRYEHGPGIYFTTSYPRAQSYAGGSKVVQEAQIDISHIVTPGSVPVTVDQVKELFAGIRLKNRKTVMNGIAEYSQRGKLTASIVVNWLVNEEALGGDAGPAVAQWLTDLGVTADINVRSNEEWLIVFDPSIIVSHRKIDPKEVTGDFPFDLPMFSHNLEKRY